MIIINYIYYSIYCGVTEFGNEQTGHRRAVPVFSFVMAFYIDSAINLLGLRPALMNWSKYYSIIILAGCIIYPMLYFNDSNKKSSVIIYFNNKMGRWRKLHALIGFLQFIGGGWLFGYTTVYCS